MTAPARPALARPAPIRAPDEIALANARLVLPGEVVAGGVLLRDGVVASVDPGAGVPRGAVDCEGDLLAPGLVELHTDNLERHLEPRPGVAWPIEAALAAHDAELAGCGITTVFDAVRIGSIPSEADAGFEEYARPVVTALGAARRAGAFRIDHRLHLRAELCSETLEEELALYGPEDGIGLLSLMEHVPGERQFRDTAAFAHYLKGRRGMGEEAARTYFAFLRDLFDRVGSRHEAAAVATARRLGAALASHDDTTVAHVEASAAHGVALAEFPTTREAAAASREAGIAVMMGAPNLIRGGSHSGNVAAEELARDDLLDIVSSDYVPAALLAAAMRLGEIWGDPARGLATVTEAPARAAGLADRGRLEPGLRADVLRVSTRGGVPTPRGVWSAGRRVA
jgi:alpha-D-ribose 1-methylphosphonate 5-triphosphate diphosphatase